MTILLFTLVFFIDPLFALSKWEWEYVLRIKVVASLEEKMKELTDIGQNVKVSELDLIKSRLMRTLNLSLGNLTSNERLWLKDRLKELHTSLPSALIYEKELDLLIAILDRI